MRLAPASLSSFDNRDLLYLSDSVCKLYGVGNTDESMQQAGRQLVTTDVTLLWSAVAALSIGHGQHMVTSDSLFISSPVRMRS